MVDEFTSVPKLRRLKRVGGDWGKRVLWVWPVMCVFKLASDIDVVSASVLASNERDLEMRWGLKSACAGGCRTIEVNWLISVFMR